MVYLIEEKKTLLMVQIYPGGLKSCFLLFAEGEAFSCLGEPGALSLCSLGFPFLQGVWSCPCSFVSMTNLAT